MVYFRTKIIKDFVKKHNIEDKSFFNPTIDDLIDPYQVPDLEAISNKIFDLIEKRKKVALLVDSDVDGISSLAIMENYLKFKKVPIISDLVPKSLVDIKEFYRKIKESFQQAGVEYIIFFDLSYIPNEFLESLSEINIRTIVCDHHEISYVPMATYYLNPKLSSDEEIRNLSSSGIAFKLVEALLKREKLFRRFFKKYVILGMFGTLSDMVPMVGENRRIVKIALNNILEEEKYRNFFGDEININYERVLFSIISQVNSLAKMGYGKEAIKILNKDRISKKELDYFLKMSFKKKKKEEALLMKSIENARSFSTPSTVIYILDNVFNASLLGQIAYKIKNLEKKNAVLIANLEDTVYKGSMRFLDNYNAFEILKKLRNLLIGFGGHVGAAGFMLQKENLEEFVKLFLEKVEECKMDVPPFADRIIYKIKFSDISEDLISDIRRISPFGIGFLPPLFHTTNISIERAKPLSSHSEHFKAIVKQGKRTFKAIGLYLSHFLSQIYSPAQTFDIWYEIGFLPYDSSEVQLKIRDIKHSKDDLYYQFLKGEEL